MPYSNQYKCIFVHIPKNAGTTITLRLQMIDGGHHSWSYYASRYPAKWRTYLRFCVVRNPWDRVYSNYTYARMAKSFWHSHDGTTVHGPHPDHERLKDMSFEQCVMQLGNDHRRFKHQGWPGQYLSVCENGTLRVDRVLKTECLDDDFTALRKELNIPGDGLLPKTNISKETGYRDQYSSKMREIVADIYSTDIALFNYSF